MGVSLVGAPISPVLLCEMGEGKCAVPWSPTSGMRHPGSYLGGGICLGEDGGCPISRTSFCARCGKRSAQCRGIPHWAQMRQTAWPGRDWYPEEITRKLNDLRRARPRCFQNGQLSPVDSVERPQVDHELPR